MKTKTEILTTVEPRSVKIIGILNSWGPDVGAKGWQFLPTSYFTAKVNGSPAVWSCWTHTYNNILTEELRHNFLVDMKLNDTGPEVLILQKALKMDGEFPKMVAPTGFFGGITLNAVKTFQAKYGVIATGFCGPITRARLNILFNH